MLNIPLISENIKLKDAALAYLNFGFSIVPARGKVPLKNWKRYQIQKPTTSEIESWWTENPEANIAVITGKISGIVVVDVDGVKTDLELPLTPISLSSPGHFHHFYKYPGVRVKSSTSLVAPGVDIRGDGGVIILPPSVHFNKNNGSDGIYQWIKQPEEMELANCPNWLLNYTNNKSTNLSESKIGLKEIVAGVGEGKRNSDATVLVGSLLARYPETDWETICWPIVTAWNEKNQPPLSDTELKNIFNSISQKEKDKNELGLEKQTQADQIVEIVLDGATLLLNQFNEVYIAFSSAPFVAYKIDSERIKKELHFLYWSKNHKTVKSESVNNAIATLEGVATENNNRQYIYNRVAKVGNTIYYDLINQNQIVKITSQGWSLETTCPVYFTRYSHQKPQIVPESGGKITDLFQFLNLKNDQSKILISTYLPTCLITDIPRVALILHGDHGSAKSSCLKLLRSILDPSELSLLTPPTYANDIVQIASHHYVIYFDNLSELSQQLSDTLCRLVTGEGFAKRKLYSDNDDIIYSFKSVIGFNGINLVATRADLLDRSLIISLDRISDEERKSEAEIFGRFEIIKPKLLGATFDAVSTMLRTEPTLIFSKKPRMADYYCFATAAAIALGYSRQELDDAFSQNTVEQNVEAIDASPTAQAIMEFIKDKTDWSGGSAALYGLLTEIADNLKLKNNFPKSPNWLWRRIREVRTNLLAQGLKIDKSETAQGSIVTITKLTNTASAATTAILNLEKPTHDGNNGNNGDIKNINADGNINKNIDLDQDSDRMLKIIKDNDLF